MQETQAFTHACAKFQEGNGVVGPRLLPVDVPWSQMLTQPPRFRHPLQLHLLDFLELPGSSPLYFPGGKVCEPLSAMLHGDRHLEDTATRQAAEWGRDKQFR